MSDALAREIGDMLRDKKATLAVAESCTGGMLGQIVTAVSGSSDWFLGGVISYSNRIKTEILGVPADLIEEQGAVCREVAQVMALSVRSRFTADYALSLTGIAGPCGGSPDKPVGLVYIACASENECKISKCRFDGGREQIRRHAVHTALTMLKDALTAETTPIRLDGTD